MQMFDLTCIAAIIFVAALINFIVTYISWQRRETQVGKYFALGMVGVTIWTFASGLDYSAVPIPLKVFFAKWEVVGYSSALAFFTLFALSYTSYEEALGKKWVKALLLFIPTSNILLAWTNELHHWVWTSIERNGSSDNVAIFRHGPGFVLVTVTSYLMILIILVTLWLATRKGSELSRRQARFLLFAASFPVIANIVYLYGVRSMEGVDWTSVTFSVTGVLFLYALSSLRLLDIVPIARDTVINGLSDGMVVLDLHNRIVDVNHAGANILGFQSAMLIGRNLEDVALFTRSFLEQPVEQEIKTELEAGSVDKLYYDVILSPLWENNSKLIGRLVIFRDITSRKKNELRLLQLSQAVSQSPASVVVTDLDGNIEYVNPHFTNLTGYSSEEVLGKNPRLLKSGNTSDDAYRDMWQTIVAGKTWSGEFLNKKKNGDLYWEHAVIAPLLGPDGQVLNFIAVKLDITERKQTEFALERRFLEIQELHKNLQETQLQLVEQQCTLAALDERRRLGRNMHDSVNQSIHSLMLFSETLVALLEKDEKEKALYVAGRMQDSGMQALREIRLLVYETQSIPGNNTNILDALEERFNMVERRVGVDAEILGRDNFVQYCPPGWNENLYWLITEALNNSLKYAQALHVKVTVQGNECQMNLDVIDDGIGFDPSSLKKRGFGMRTMRERAELLGGELSVDSSPGKGTCIRFIVNIGANHGAHKNPDRG